MQKKEIKSAIATLSDNGINPYDLMLAIGESEVVPDSIVESRRARVKARDGKITPQGFLKNAYEDLQELDFSGKDQVLKVISLNLGKANLDGLGELPSPTQDQLFKLLHGSFTIVPLLAGADKFFNFSANWGEFLAPSIVAVSPLPKRNLMMLAGGVEMMIGVLTAIQPRLGGYAIAGYLGLFIANILISGKNYDLLLHDIPLAIAAYVMAELSPEQMAMTEIES